MHLTTGGKNAQLFPTPVGKSYSCGEEMTVDLGTGDLRAQLLLRDMRVQPFIFRKGEFGPGELNTDLHPTCQQPMIDRFEDDCKDDTIMKCEACQEVTLT